ncbi:MAG TPA: hypothetical protein DHW02_19850 [Ktedonobacter sp.]|nr:hypothetical protein [Ktedonobacter sp.]
MSTSTVILPTQLLPQEKMWRVLIPASAGCIMLLAAFLPWLTDPVKGNMMAWRLPLDIVWQFHVDVVNYGVLCTGCASYVFYITFAKARGHNDASMIIAGLLCFVPLLLFLLQYTCIDIVASTILAHHKTQVLLIQERYGYGAPADRIKLQPFDVNATTVMGRLILLVDQVSIGALLPLVSAWLLLDSGRRGSRTMRRIRDGQGTHRIQSWRIWLTVGCVTLLLFGLGPSSTLCEYEAKLLLSSGNYTQALYWLNVADMLNPGLEQVPSFHIERGQALYFLYPNQQSDDSRIYLAWVYRGQRDYLDAYQELLPVWQTHRNESWTVSEMSTTLEYLSEYTKYLNGPVVLRPAHDDTALRWLLQLTLVDSSNVYGQYQVGRIQCDLHNYPACAIYMRVTLRLNHNADIQSSAYTYMALSDIGLGDYASGRNLLFQAVQLDPSYRNNTAREELSGLH